MTAITHCRNVLALLLAVVLSAATACETPTQPVPPPRCIDFVRARPEQITLSQGSSAQVVATYERVGSCMGSRTAIEFAIAAGGEFIDLKAANDTTATIVGLSPGNAQVHAVSEDKRSVYAIIQITVTN